MTLEVTFVSTLLGASAPASPPGEVSSTEPRRSAGLFRAFWRWHFYASIVVIPVFVMLSVTGLVILFKWQIDPAVNPGVMSVVQPAYGSTVAPSAQEAAAMAVHPGATVTAAQFGGDDRTTAFTMELPDGQTRNVYVNPWTAEVTGDLDPAKLPSNVATEIHGMILFGEVAATKLFDDPITGSAFKIGSIGDQIIELAACWGIVMTLTGYYLFFKGRRGRLRRVASGTRGVLLRHRHSVVGAIVGGWILLLVGSGLPWTGLWGGKVQSLVTGSGFSLWGEDPGATSTLGKQLDAAGNTSAPAPWAEGAAVLPKSGTPAMAPMPGMDHGAVQAAGGVVGRVSLDAVVTVAARDGLPGPYFVLYPAEDDGVFSVMSDMWHDKSNPAYEDTTLERVTHIDQYSGTVAGRYSFDEYSPVAKVVSQTISAHEGQRFGSLNFVASALFCVGILVLCITGPVMWWRRRPKGSLGAPRGAMPLRAKPWLLGILIALGVFLPLFGLSLLVVFAFEFLVVRRRRTADVASA